MMRSAEIRRTGFNRRRKLAMGLVPKTLIESISTALQGVTSENNQDDAAAVA